MISDDEKMSRKEKRQLRRKQDSLREQPRISQDQVEEQTLLSKFTRTIIFLL